MTRYQERTGVGRMVARRIVGLTALIGALTVGAVAHAAPTVVATVPVGAHPSDVAVTPNGAFAYVLNRFDGTVSVINTSTNTVVASIASLGYSPYGIAITPNGAFAYVTLDGENRVVVIDTSTNTVVNSIAVGSEPESIAITPNGAFAYVPSLRDGLIYVIDTSTNTVVGTPIDVGVGNLNDIAFTPNGAFAYVAKNFGDGMVVVIDTATRTVVNTIILPSTFAYRIAITPNGAFAYVAHAGMGGTTVDVIDTSTNTVVGSPITVGSTTTDIAITPNGAFAYVPYYGGPVGYVGVIDTSTNTLAGSPIVVGSGPLAVAISPNGAFAYIANSTGDSVSVIATNPGPSGPTVTFPGTTGTTSPPVVAGGQATYTITQTQPTGTGNVYTMTVPTNATSVAVTLSGTANAPSILVKVTDMPAGTTKDISLPKGSGSKVCIVDKANAQIVGSGPCPGNNISLPLNGNCSLNVLVDGDPGDGTGTKYSHPIDVCLNNGIVTVKHLKHSAVGIIGDSDNDGVSDDLDWCPGTVLSGSIPTSGNLKAGNLGDGSVDALGCNASQILACKTGTNAGETKYGVTAGSQHVFESINSSNPIGWAQQCTQLYQHP